MSAGIMLLRLHLVRLGSSIDFAPLQAASILSSRLRQVLQAAALRHVSRAPTTAGSILSRSPGAGHKAGGYL